jgi:hypothetical protein
VKYGSSMRKQKKEWNACYVSADQTASFITDDLSMCRCSANESE